MLRVFFGHHKAANSWVRSVLRDAGTALNQDLRVFHHPRDWAGYDSLGDLVRAERPEMIALTNARRENLETLPEFRGFHVIRDPRDIVVSAYFSHRHSHPVVLPVGNATWEELPAHRATLTELDHDAGLLAEIAFVAPFIDSIASWDYRRPEVLELRMEDLTRDPLRHWSAIFRHLDLVDDLVDPDQRGVADPFSRWWRARRTAAVTWNLATRRGTPRTMASLRRILPTMPLRRLPGSYVPWVVDRYSFAAMSGGRQPGEEDAHHHYRRGVAGDWRNHLNAGHLEAFRARFGDLVTRLGYE